MKRILSILLCVVATVIAFAQAPQGMDFQSIIRDSKGNLVTNQTIGLKISILKGGVSGTAVYSETHNATTNNGGLVTVTIGRGTTSNDFSTIDWGNGTYFIKTEVDVTGGTTYTLSATNQMLSVPYALYAGEAKSVSHSGTKEDYEARLTALEQFVLGNNVHYPVSHDQIFSDGAILAPFSVSDTKKVYFSRGNLQYSTSGTHKCADGTTQKGTWRFNTNQYTTCGQDNAKISSTYTGWIDLFGFGTSGYQGKAPYTSSVTKTDYVQMDISGQYYDWGIYNAISNGGNQPNQWRTLTKDEWNFLLFERPDANKKLIYASVNGIPGIILLPDNVSGQLPKYNVSTTEFSINVFNNYQWDLFEEKGAVFLRLRGYRTSTSYESGYGYYWSTNFVSDHYARMMYYSIVDKKITANVSTETYYGSYVRLVKEVY